MSYTLPISPSYRKPVFEAVVLQFILGILSLMILDGGDCARICGAALLAFWGGAVVLIWRHRHSPTKTDLELIRFGYLPVVVIAFVVIHLAWAARGF
ncbi:MAG: hypothetical protein ACKOKG_04555 [Verrucomicrobiota bacterium]